MTKRGLLVGTPEYMAPEQADGSADRRSDLYSVGVVLYQMLTGRLPFRGDSPLTVAVKHITEAPELPSQIAAVNPKLEAVCLRALSKTPDERYGSAREMRSALRAAINLAPGRSSAPQSVITGGGRRRPRRRMAPAPATPLVVGLALATLFAAALGARAGGWRRAPAAAGRPRAGGAAPSPATPCRDARPRRRRRCEAAPREQPPEAIPPETDRPRRRVPARHAALARQARRATSSDPIASAASGRPEDRAHRDRRNDRRHRATRRRRTARGRGRDGRRGAHGGDGDQRRDRAAAAPPRRSISATPACRSPRSPARARSRARTSARRSAGRRWCAAIARRCTPRAAAAGNRGAAPQDRHRRLRHQHRARGRAIPTGSQTMRREGNARRTREGRRYRRRDRRRDAHLRVPAMNRARAAEGDAHSAGGAGSGCVASRWLLDAGCATSTRDGLDVAQLPETVRPDYALFARRCSKCHSLARPLGSGITDDAVWIAYVDKMRRQPGSGISPQDAAPILRFLHYYSSEQRRLKRGGRDGRRRRTATPASATQEYRDPPAAGETATRSMRRTCIPPSRRRRLLAIATSSSLRRVASARARHRAQLRRLGAARLPPRARRARRRRAAAASSTASPPRSR